MSKGGANGREWSKIEQEVMDTYQKTDGDEFLSYNTSLSFSVDTEMPLAEGENFELSVLSQEKSNARGKQFTVNPVFPKRFTGNWAFWGIDEGFAKMLTGIVEAIKPAVVLETGTNRGRSARALTEGLKNNGGGMLYTIDQVDHQIKESGAIPVDQQEYVTQIIGGTPGVFDADILHGLRGIEFAFLDGDHTAAGVAAELEYIDEHRAPNCTVLIDNCMDDAWPALREYFMDYDTYPCISLPTMTGTIMVQM